MKKNRRIMNEETGPSGGDQVATDTEERDQTADDLVLISLHQQIAELKNREIQLEYRAAGMGDMARMNVAGQLMAAMITADGVNGKPGNSFEALDEYIPLAVFAADKLIQHYQDIIEKNEVEYQQKLAAQLEEEKDGTVQ